MRTSLPQTSGVVVRVPASSRCEWPLVPDVVASSRNLLTEHIVIACIGGALGIALAWLALRGVTLTWGHKFRAQVNCIWIFACSPSL